MFRRKSNLSQPGLLHQLVAAKQLDKVKKLLARSKASKEQLAELDEEGHTPLGLAIKMDNAKMVSLITGAYQSLGVDINMKDKYGYTALHLAVSCVDESILLDLLRFPGIQVNIENQDKNTPLHYFCAKFRSPNVEEPFKELIQKGQNVNARNRNGETPLHKAVFNNSVRLLMCELLLENNAQVDQANHTNETALHYAVRLGREDLVFVLIKAGANIDIRGTNLKGDEGQTPYEIAIEQKMEGIASLLRHVSDVTDWLTTNGLREYRDIFVREEVFLDILPELDNDALTDMGITKSGARLKILNACKNLKIQPPSPSIPRITPPTESYSEPLLVTPSPEASEQSRMLQRTLSQLPHTHLEEDWLIQHSEIEFTKKLGSGARGKVYRGIFKSKSVAIKVAKESTDPDQIEDFKKEFQVMNAVRSPYTVGFFGACLEPKLHIVMEFCERGTLYHVMNDKKVDFTWNRFFRFSKDMFSALGVLHSCSPQIVHRDYKSLNLLVTRDWNTKLSDFGTSRFMAGKDLDDLHEVVGTFAYCCPEVYLKKPYTAKSDVFSAGVVLWELIYRTLTGSYIKPYSEFHDYHFDFQITEKVASERRRPSYPSTCPTPLADLLEACWNQDPDLRPTWQNVVTTLEHLEVSFREDTNGVWPKVGVSTITDTSSESEAATS